MTSREIKRKPSEDYRESSKNDNVLILHNDDVHSFDYVTIALMEVCGHNFEQATQCTIIAHYTGKCDIKKGEFSKLKPMKDALMQRELNATID